MPDRIDRLSGGDLSQTLHASCVAFDGCAVLIAGKSGSGKSALALQLMALGATLVSDDRTHLALVDGKILADAPETIAGLIEARGVGILHAEAAGPMPVGLVVDLDLHETDRLPKPRSLRLMGQSIPVLASIPAGHFPAAILQFLRHGRLKE